MGSPRFTQSVAQPVNLPLLLAPPARIGPTSSSRPRCRRPSRANLARRPPSPRRLSPARPRGSCHREPQRRPASSRSSDQALPWRGLDRLATRNAPARFEMQSAQTSLACHAPSWSMRSAQFTSTGPSPAGTCSTSMSTACFASWCQGWPSRCRTWACKGSKWPTWQRWARMRG